MHAASARQSGAVPYLTMYFPLERTPQVFGGGSGEIDITRFIDLVL